MIDLSLWNAACLYFARCNVVVFGDFFTHWPSLPWWCVTMWSKPKKKPRRDVIVSCFFCFRCAHYSLYLCIHCRSGACVHGSITRVCFCFWLLATVVLVVAHVALLLFRAVLELVSLRFIFLFTPTNYNSERHCVCCLACNGSSRLECVGFSSWYCAR